MSSLTYQKSGVNIDKGNLFVKKIKPLIKSTKRTGWVSDIGAFSGLFKPSNSSYKEPLIVASTDGVGTKLLLSGRARKYDTLGIDLVAMCANDIVTCGAEPLFFLDYIACGKLDKAKSLSVIKGILAGCRESGMTLLGGETAELPGLYKKEDYDLAGFSVGMISRKKIIDGSKIKKGDCVLGLASSGIHSNGYSLVRKVFSKGEIRKKFKNTLLKPTKIYVKPISALIKRVTVKGIVHITGGGFYDNIVRVLPKNKSIVINHKAWPVPKIFRIIQKRSRLDNTNMYRTFNMGIGMVAIVARKDVKKAKSILSKSGQASYLIGEVVDGKRKVVI